MYLLFKFLSHVCLCGGAHVLFTGTNTYVGSLDNRHIYYVHISRMKQMYNFCSGSVTMRRCSYEDLKVSLTNSYNYCSFSMT